LSQSEEDGKTAYLHAALTIGVSSLEAHINAIAEEMLLKPNLSVLDRSILLEADFTLKNGEYVITKNLKIYRTLDRFEFIFKRFGKIELDKTQAWWSEINNVLDVRNHLIHPKDELDVSQKTVESALDGILSALDAIYYSLYKKHYPALNRKLQSKMVF